MLWVGAATKEEEPIKAICCLEQFPRPAIFALRFRNLFEQAAVSHNELEMF